MARKKFFLSLALGQFVRILTSYGDVLLWRCCDERLWYVVSQLFSFVEYLMGSTISDLRVSTSMGLIDFRGGLLRLEVMNMMMDNELCASGNDFEIHWLFVYEASCRISFHNCA